MATYITLLKFTEQGIRNIKEGPSRVEAAEKMFRESGAAMKDFYLTLGRYDAIAVFEAPDDETVARNALAIGSRGNVRTETMRAFTADEYRQIVKKLP